MTMQLALTMQQRALMWIPPGDPTASEELQCEHDR